MAHRSKAGARFKAYDRVSAPYPVVPYSLRRMESHPHAAEYHHDHARPAGQFIDGNGPVIEHVRNGKALTPEGKRLIEMALEKLEAHELSVNPAVDRMFEKALQEYRSGKFHDLSEIDA